MSVLMPLQDVIRLILQFLLQNNLTRSYSALKAEAQVSINLLPDSRAFLDGVQAADWEKVLPALKELQLPEKLYLQLCKQVIVQNLVRGDIQSSQILFQALIQNSGRLKSVSEEVKGLRLLVHQKHRHRELRTDLSRRKALVQGLASCMRQPPPNRLLTLLGYAIKYQHKRGQLAAGLKTDFFLGTQQRSHRQQNKLIRELKKAFEYPQEIRPQSMAVSCEGRYLAIGTSKGFVEIYDPLQLQLHSELTFQKDAFIAHAAPVLALVFNQSSQLILSGDKSGQIRGSRVKDGRLLVKIELGMAIQCLCLSPDPALIEAGGKQIMEVGLVSRSVVRRFNENRVISRQLHIKGEKMFSFGEGCVSCWDFNSGLFLKRLEFGGGLALMNDRQILACSDNQLKTFDFEFNLLKSVQFECSPLAILKTLDCLLFLQKSNSQEYEVAIRSEDSLHLKALLTLGSEQVQSLVLVPKRCTLAVASCRQLQFWCP